MGTYAFGSLCCGGILTAATVPFSRGYDRARGIIYNTRTPATRSRGYGRAADGYVNITITVYVNRTNSRVILEGIPESKYDFFVIILYIIMFSVFVETGKRRNVKTTTTTTARTCSTASCVYTRCSGEPAGHGATRRTAGAILWSRALRTS